MKKKFVVIIGMLCSVAFLNLWTVPVFAYEDLVSNRMDTEFQVYSANIGWRYTNEGGRLYRRLYDYTNQKWIGEWELCP